MKKEYIEPLVKVFSDYDMDLMQDTSPGVTGTVNGNPEIGYGGTDDEGEKDPDAKYFHWHSVWDEE